jgi:hypothetical protein
VDLDLADASPSAAPTSLAEPAVSVLDELLFLLRELLSGAMAAGAYAYGVRMRVGLACVWVCVRVCVVCVRVCMRASLCKCV